MNNENNNQINNQGYNQQPMNNQPMNNQGYNQQPMMNNQPMNNQGYNQQTMMNNQPMNNQSYNQQPMMNNQYNNYNGNPTPNKKDNKMLFIILGVVALIVVAVVVLIIVLNNNNSKGNTINDYENGGVVDNGNTGNNNNNQQEVNNNNNEDDENSIAYKGFSIPKQLGYQYEVDATSGLVIGNNTFATMVEVTYGTLESVKSVKDQLVAEYTNLGMNPSNVKVSNYGGKEALTMEITMEGQKALFYVIDAGSDYSFLGLAMNPSFTIDYNDIQTSVSLLSKAKYTGVYRVNTDDVNVIEFKNLFE